MGGIENIINSRAEEKIREAQRASGVRKTSKKSSTQKKKKKVNYNFKEVSNRVLKSKTSTSARRAVTLARNKVASLKGKLGNGEYNVNDLQRAIIHAEKILRVAKKRMKHLREEEDAARAQDSKEREEAMENAGESTFFDQEDMLKMQFDEGFDQQEMEMRTRELMEQMQALMEASMDSFTDSMRKMMEESGGLEELSDELLGGSRHISPEELEFWKKKHRAEELREILEADMKYLKALFAQMEKDRQSAASGVSLELGGREMPVPAPAPMPAAEGTMVDVSV